MPTSPVSSTDTISVLHDNHAHPHPGGGAEGGGGADHKSVASAPGPPSSAPWAAQLQASFGAIADQLGAAAQALALVPSSSALASTPPSHHAPGRGSDVDVDVAALADRMDRIEETQATLIAQLENLSVKVSAAAERERERGSPEVQVEPQNAGPSAEELEKRIGELRETFKLEQDRLYARLRNAAVTVYKMPIVPLPTATGKPPQNFPATKGEFEHLTKERYEAILKAYGQPIKGDTNAKRQALRVFIGLPD
ncbi:hypothetical protein DENSPDRAFT_616842 [Dentipellis sp. KUC8613]|nr:hypothetical protein DENSPDRAFT_616842 [Dentipellis sp. KUC8613]